LFLAIACGTYSFSTKFFMESKRPNSLSLSRQPFSKIFFVANDKLPPKIMKIMYLFNFLRWIQIWIHKQSILHACTGNSRWTIIHANAHNAMQAASDRIENNELCTTFYAESLYGFKFNPLYMHVHLIHAKR
jgi:hypothetical protein